VRGSRGKPLADALAWVTINHLVGPGDDCHPGIAVFTEVNMFSGSETTARGVDWERVRSPRLGGGTCRSSDRHGRGQDGRPVVDTADAELEGPSGTGAAGRSAVRVAVDATHARVAVGAGSGEADGTGVRTDITVNQEAAPTSDLLEAGARHVDEVLRRVGAVGVRTDLTGRAVGGVAVGVGSHLSRRAARRGAVRVGTHLSRRTGLRSALGNRHGTAGRQRERRQRSRDRVRTRSEARERQVDRLVCAERSDRLRLVPHRHGQRTGRQVGVGSGDGDHAGLLTRCHTGTGADRDDRLATRVTLADRLDLRVDVERELAAELDLDELDRLNDRLHLDRALDRSRHRDAHLLSRGTGDGLGGGLALAELHREVHGLGDRDERWLLLAGVQQRVGAVLLEPDRDGLAHRDLEVDVPLHHLGAVLVRRLDDRPVRSAAGVGAALVDDAGGLDSARGLGNGELTDGQSVVRGERPLDAEVVVDQGLGVAEDSLRVRADPVGEDPTEADRGGRRGGGHHGSEAHEHADERHERDVPTARQVGHHATHDAEGSADVGHVCLRGACDGRRGRCVVLHGSPSSGDPWAAMLTSCGISA
jgi:hypothetical protein